MKYNTWKITKEQYDKCVEITGKEKGHMPCSVEREVFPASIRDGYGLYGTEFYEKDGEYFVDFEMGSSCD